MLARAGPGAELLAIVAEDDHRAGTPLGDAAEVVDRILRRLERNRVAKLLAAGEHLQDQAVFFGDIVAVELLFAETGVFEVEVVEHGVLDPRADDVGRERLLPDPLRHPHAADLGADAALQPVGVAGDLTDAIARRDHRHDRFEERPADNFNPPGGDQRAEAVDVLGMAGVEPLHQRAARMETNLQSFIPLEDVEERQIAVLVRLLEDSVEVADWLMVVQDEHKAQRLIHSGVKWGWRGGGGQWIRAASANRTIFAGFAWRG